MSTTDLSEGEVADPFRFNFEIAWEVANKGKVSPQSSLNRDHLAMSTSYNNSIQIFIVGGIYTVLRSKAGVTTAELGDSYCMLGKYNESTVKLEVEIVEPEMSIMKETIEVLRNEGFNVSEHLTLY